MLTALRKYKVLIREIFFFSLWLKLVIASFPVKCPFLI